MYIYLHEPNLHKDMNIASFYVKLNEFVAFFMP